MSTPTRHFKTKISGTSIILGIDPGLADTGFGVIKKNGSDLELISYGCIKTPAGTKDSDRLQEIATGIRSLISKYKPGIVSVEKLFFAKNAKTALAVGQARGVVLSVCAEQSLMIHEFTPLQVKMAVTGYGKADKKQVQQMVRHILHLTTLPKSDDAADALAVAICCVQSI